MTFTLGKKFGCYIVPSSAKLFMTIFISVLFSKAHAFMDEFEYKNGLLVLMVELSKYLLD